MLEKHLDIYEKEEIEEPIKMNWKKALFFTLVDSIFIGIKIGIIVSITFLFMTNFWVDMTTEIGQKICPLLK